MILIALSATGFAAGLFGAWLGLGGGIFLVPALSLLYHLPIQVAVGTSLVGVIATSAGAAAASPHGRGADIGLALRLELTTAAGAIAGGLLAGHINEKLLSILFAGVAFLSGGYILYKSREKARDANRDRLYRQHYTIRHWKAGSLIGALAGMVSGLLGVGGGFIKVPVMYAVMDVPLGIATATSNFMVGITAAASVFIYINRGDIHPLVVIPTTLGVLTGAVLGVTSQQHLKAAWLRSALVGVLFLIGSQMLLKGL